MRGVVFVRFVSGVEPGLVARRGARWARVSLRDGRATVLELRLSGALRIV